MCILGMERIKIGIGRRMARPSIDLEKKVTKIEQ